MLIKDGRRKVSIYQAPALCQAFQNYSPMESLQQGHVGVLAPIFEKRQPRLRDFVFTQGHKTTEWPGQSLKSGLWASEPVALLSSAWVAGLPPGNHFPAAEDSLLLSTWTSCPLTGKGNDLQLRPGSPRLLALTTETVRSIHA